jgi:hypothetical protein
VHAGGMGRISMHAELFCFSGCPSYHQALANLKEALRAEGWPEKVDVIPVVDARDAEAKRFIGSPTIRFDGIDTEGPEADERGYGFGCRVYATNGRMAGWPSIEQLRQALRRGRGVAGDESGDE